MQKMKKAVVVETLGFSFLPILLFYRFFGYETWYFNTSSLLSRFPKFKLLIQKYSIQKLEWKEFFFDRQYASHQLSYNNFERIWELNFEKSKTLKVMSDFMESEEIEIAYKNYLIKKVEPFYRLCLLIDYHFKKSGFSKIILLPTDFLEIKKWTENLGDSNIGLDRFYVPFWANIYGNIHLRFHKFIQIGIALILPLWTLFHLRKVRLKKIQGTEYQTGFRVYSTDMGFKRKYQKIDFLIDGQKIKPEDVFFCNERKIDQEYSKEFEERGYKLIPLQEVLRDIDLNFIWIFLLRKHTIKCLTLFFTSFREKKEMVYVSNAILYYYPFWVAFLEKYRFKNYVVYNNTSFTHVIRNVIFSAKGVKSWWYNHSEAILDPYKPPQLKRTVYEVDYLYLLYDNFISWGLNMTSYYNNRTNKISNFHNLGIIWSEFVKNSSATRQSKLLRTKIIKSLKGSPNKLIAVFDTSYGVDAPLKEEDGIRFIRDIQKLLEDMPEVGVIFKEKKPREELSQRIASVYKKMGSQGRLYASTDVNEPDVQEAIAASDLVISACFTSPTLVALGAGKKGIFYDPTSLFKGFYYENIPKFVANNYKELKEIVKFWLYEITDEAFLEYLEQHIKNNVDSNLEGEAISRLRKLITQSHI
jgi:polysaccharide biosynthesis PFTS motif protein